MRGECRERDKAGEEELRAHDGKKKEGEEIQKAKKLIFPYFSFSLPPPSPPSCPPLTKRHLFNFQIFFFVLFVFIYFFDYTRMVKKNENSEFTCLTGILKFSNPFWNFTGQIDL
jgi:hypothetical protein